MKFHDYEWHDAKLKNIQIDRTNLNGGDVNSIVMLIVWPDGSPARVIFSGVKNAVFNLKFGLILNEGDTILRADIAQENDLGLVEFYEKWRPFGLFGINYFLFQTNSGSKIKIFAEKFEIIADGSVSD